MQSSAIAKLKNNCLTRQQYRTLRGQIKAGDVDGAMKGLARIQARKGVHHDREIQLDDADKLEKTAAVGAAEGLDA